MYPCIIHKQTFWKMDTDCCQHMVIELGMAIWLALDNIKGFNKRYHQTTDQGLKISFNTDVSESHKKNN